MGKLRRLRINKGERSSAFAGATSGAVVGGASGAGVGAAIGLAMIPIAPISVPIGFLVGGLIGGACGAPSGAAVAVKRGRNSVEELNVGDARRYGDHKTADMVRLRDDVELPAQAEDPSTYATATTLYEKMDAPSSSLASSSIPEEEGQFSAWLNPMGLSAPATTPSYAYTSSSTSATSAYGREDPAERLLRSKTTSSSSRYAGTDEYSQESNRGRRATSHKTKSFDQEDDVDYDDDGEAGLERRRGSSRRGTSSSSSQRYASSQNDYHRPGNLVPVLPPQPATDVHLRHYDPQEELSRRFDSWERRDRDRELERQEQERRDEFYAKQLQLQYDRESGGSSSSGGSRPRSSASSGSTRKTREVSRKKEVDPEKTLDSLWGSEPFY